MIRQIMGNLFEVLKYFQGMQLPDKQSYDMDEYQT